jgi:serine-protein kinase ATM
VNFPKIPIILFLFGFLTMIFCDYRTASAMKLKGAQSVTEESKTDEALNHIIGFNLSTATGVDEAADRALTTVARKLDKTLSVEFTVNELIAEATDVGNLAMMYMGESLGLFILFYI